MRGPNMSYCAFENTNLALDQLTYMVAEAIDDNEKLDFSSRDEEYAFRQIRYNMRDLLDLLKEYDQAFPIPVQDPDAEEESDDV
jgi:hypothetical protein